MVSSDIAIPESRSCAAAMRTPKRAAPHTSTGMGAKARGSSPLVPKTAPTTSASTTDWTTSSWRDACPRAGR